MIVNPKEVRVIFRESEWVPGPVRITIRWNNNKNQYTVVMEKGIASTIETALSALYGIIFNVREVEVEVNNPIVAKILKDALRDRGFSLIC